MSQFKKTNAFIYTKTDPAITPEALYWKKLGVPVLVKEFGAIDYIDFSPVEPHYFAVTCSVRVQIYNPTTKLVVKNLSKFQESAYGGSFRKDGNLLVAGDEQAHVRLFDVSSKNILRLFDGHKGPVHRTFFTSDGTHVASFSDDRTVKYWDIPTEKAINTFSEHTDYIRAGCVSPVSPNILVSGGYDKSVKMYDTRTNDIVLQVNHGSPVESMLFLPAGSIFITAGGTSINVWDALAGGRMIAQLSQHHKTVTCLELASNGKRLLSGSLDRHVKIYDTATYQVVHNIDNPNAVLSLGVSKTDDTLVTGMVDGLIAIYRKDSGKDDGDTHKSDKSGSKKRFKNVFGAVVVEESVPELIKRKELKHDECLRKFEYSKALDAVFNPNAVKTPERTVSVIKELIHRKGLQRTLVNRSHKFLNKVLVFLIRHIGDYRFTSTLIDASNILLDMYEKDFDQFAGTNSGVLFVNLSKCLKQEEEIIMDCIKIQGALELLLSGADINNALDDTADDQNIIDSWQASNKAKETAIINVD